MAHTIISTHTLLPKLHSLSPSLNTITTSPFSSRDLEMRMKMTRRGKGAVKAGNWGRMRMRRRRREDDGIMSPWSIREDPVVRSSEYHKALPMGYAEGGSMGYTSLHNQPFPPRIISCSGPIYDGMANMMVAQLLYLDAVDPTRDIVMYVNCPGGSVIAAMAIFDTMRHIRPDVSTLCVGLAASLGSFILAAGAKGKRYSLPSSRIMIYQPSDEAAGSIGNIEIEMNEALFHKATLIGHLAYFTGKSLQQVTRDTEQEFFMSPQEAKNYGLIDGVIMNPLKALHPLATDSSDETLPPSADHF